MSLVSVAQLLQSISSSIEALPLRGQLNIEGLKIGLRGEDSNLSTWIGSRFGWLNGSGVDGANQQLEIGVVGSDNWIAQIIRLNDADQFPVETRFRGPEILKRITVTEQLVIDYFPAIGVAWISDLANCRTRLIYSSRTPLPMDELRNGLFDIINRYMDANGWHTVLGDAFEFNQRCCLLVSDRGMGKTTLLANAIGLGGSFISSERVFIKETDEGFRIRAFPQTIDVGIGTALQLSPLTHFIERPDHLACLQQAFEPERVWNTPRDQVTTLPDQLRFLPNELTAALRGPKPVGGGPLATIIFPELSSGQAPTLLPLQPEQAYQKLAENYVAPENDQVYPGWLSLDFHAVDSTDPVQFTRKLSQLPVHWLKFELADDSESTLQSVGQQLQTILPPG